MLGIVTFKERGEAFPHSRALGPGALALSPSPSNAFFTHMRFYQQNFMRKCNFCRIIGSVNTGKIRALREQRLSVSRGEDLDWWTAWGGAVGS